MYTPGTLIYFDPFHFDDGEDSKPKYFLVLKIFDNDTALLATLPSSKDHLPSGQNHVHGCLEDALSCINCYVLEARRPVLTNGWAFPKTTFLYGNWLTDFKINSLLTTYAIEGVDYEIVGVFEPSELQGIINCFANSATVKRKYKRVLAG